MNLLSRRFGPACLWLALFPSSLLGAVDPPRTDPGPVQSRDDEVEKELKLLRRRALDRRAENRLEAYRELVRWGDAGKAVLAEAVAAQWKKDLKAFEKALRSTVKKKARWLEGQLGVRREAAIACIFDRKVYPDEAHGVVGQPKVDHLVGRVRDIWENPCEVLRAEFEEVDAIFSGPAQTLQWMRVAGVGQDLPDEDALMEQADALFPVRAWTEDSTHKWNTEIRKYNEEECLTSADVEERAVVFHTNEYRWMLGYRIVEIDERLVRAARKHSVEMHDLEYFAHDSPVEANRSPTLRARIEGYSSGVAENIAHGNSGLAAFNGWYNSSGHHRNLLGSRHVQIGVGRAVLPHGGLFTQCFGNGSSLRTKDIKDPEILYLAQLKKLDPADADSEYRLAQWCRKRGLAELATGHAQAAVVLDGNHKKAREMLGQKLVRGEWVLTEGSEEEESPGLAKLKAAMRSDAATERGAAVKSLAELGDPKARGMIVRALEDSAAEVRSAAAKALGEARDERNVKPLLPLLEDPNNHTRHEVCAALLRLKEPTGMEKLLADLDGPQGARLSASRCLFQLTGESNGYRWDLPLDKRAEAIERWRAWWARNREWDF